MTSRDSATGRFTSSGGGMDLGSAYAKVLIDESGVDAGVSSIKDKFQTLGSNLTSIGTSMTVLGGGFLAFGVAAIKSFSDSQDQLAQLDSVLKSTTAHNGEWATSTAMSADDLQKLSDQLDTANHKLGEMQQVYDSNTKHTLAQTLALQDQKDEVAALNAQMAAGNATTSTMINVTHMSRDALIDLSKGFQDVTKFSDETVLSAENMLLTFTNIGKNVFPDATKTVLDMSQALGQDTKSSAVQLGKALNDPIKGITALQRVGVAFTESQKAMITQLVNAGKVEDAQRIILKELQTEFGGSAEAAGKTFSGQLVILQNHFDDLMETIGEKLLPIAEEFIGWIGRAITWFQNLDPFIQNIIIGFGAFMASLAVIGPVIAVIGVGISAVSGIIASLGAILSVFLAPIALVVAAIGALYLAFQSNFLGIRDFLQPIFDSISKFFENFSNNVKLYGSLILLYAEYYFQGVVIAIQKIIDKIGDFISANPAFVAVMIGVGVVIAGAALVAAALPIVLGLITGAVGLLTTALGVLLSPAVLLIGAIAGIVFVASQLYPGGLVKLFKDAQLAALQLATLGFGALSIAADWASSKFQALLELVNRFITGVQGISGIINLLSTGQVSLGQVINAATNGSGGTIQPVTSGSSTGSGVLNAASNWFNQQSNVVPIPPVGGGSSLPLSQQGSGQGFQSGGITHNGDVIINANTEAGGRAAAKGWADELEDRYRGRGNG